MPNYLRQFLANSPYAAILIVFIFVPPFITNQYYIQVLIFINIYIILALSLNLLNGYVGLLSIGHAAFYGIGAYASAKFMMELKLPFILAMPAAALTSGLFGYLIAKPTLRLSGIYMTLATLGFNIIFFLILQNRMSFTNGPLGIMDIPEPNVFGWQITTRLDYYYLALILVIITLVSMHRLINCRLVVTDRIPLKPSWERNMMASAGWYLLISPLKFIVCLTKGKGYKCYFAVFFKILRG